MEVYLGAQEIRKKLTKQKVFSKSGLTEGRTKDPYSKP